MAQGFETRGLIPDKNEQRAAQADPINMPQTPVMAPNPSSFSRVGTGGVVDALLEHGGPAMKRWAEKREETQRIDAELMHSQGATEEEMRKKGRVHTETWISMEAVSAGNDMYNQGVEDIRTQYAQLPPDEYRKLLQQKNSELIGQYAKDDYTKKVTVGVIRDVMPRLMQEQVRAHDAYNQQQGVAQYGNLLRSTAARTENDTVDKLREVMSPEGYTALGLSREQAKEEIMSAIKFDLANGREITSKALEATFPNSLMAREANTVNPAFHAAMVRAESSGRDFNPDGTVFRGPLIKEGPHKGDRAWGRYQVMSSTLDDPGLGIVPARDRTTEEVTRVGREYAEALYAKYDGDPILASLGYHNGYPTVDKWIKAYGDPRNGQTTHEEFLAKVQDKAPVGAKYARNVFQYMGEVPLDIPGEGDAVSSSDPLFLQLGMTTTDLMSIQDAREKYVKERGNTAQIMQAIERNTVGALTSDQQQKALEYKANMIYTDLQKSGLAGDQIDRAAEQEYRTFLVDNKVVDQAKARELTNVLTPRMALDKDGNVTEDAAKAYAYISELRKQGGTAYAEQYLTDDASKMFYRNAAFLDQGHVNSEAAIKQAADRAARKEKGDVEPEPAAPNPIKVAENIKKLWDRTDFDWSDFFLPRQGFGEYNMGNANPNVLSRSAPSATEMTALRNDKTLETMITQRALEYQRNGYLPEAAEKAAMIDEVRRTTNILGSVVRSNADTTLYEDAGVPQYSDVPNFFHEASIELLRRVGPKVWGSEWKPFQETEGLMQGLKAFSRGVPIGRVQAGYNSATSSFTYTLYSEKGERVGTPLSVPARQLGTFGKEVMMDDIGMSDPIPSGLQGRARARYIYAKQKEREAADEASGAAAKRREEHEDNVEAFAMTSTLY